MCTFLLIDLSSRLDTKEVRALVRALDYPTGIADQKADEIIANYQANIDMPILGAEHEGRLVGFIGLELQSSKLAVIQHIAVRSDYRRKGIGRFMLETVCQQFGFARIFAETDKDAVDFYRCCGFTIQSLGEKYLGTERYWCSLDRAV